jgi:hypothetical protein
MRLLLAALCAVAAASVLTGCAAATSSPDRRDAPASAPGRTVHETVRRAITLLENHHCAVFAVDFLSPIKRGQIEDLDAYRKRRACSPEDRGNLDDVLLALRLALGAEPVISGVKATIDLSGIGIAVTKLEFVKYIDGRWYFNEL